MQLPLGSDPRTDVLRRMQAARCGRIGRGNNPVVAGLRHHLRRR